jgi:alpha-beta hydrolase superfamily lysophospholipase
MRSDTFSLPADDGVSIFVHRWLPDGGVRGIVQIAHGVAEHAARYARLAERLTASGWAVYGSDHRGHGRTATTEAMLGHFGDEDGWARVVADLRRVAQHAHREHPGVPLVLFGHSMGSYLAQTLVLAHPQEVDALILSGTTAGGSPLVTVAKQIAKLERMRKGKSAKSAVMSEVLFAPFRIGLEGRTKFDWLSRDPIEVDKYVADSRCGFDCSSQLWIDLLGALESLGRGQWKRLPRDLPILVFAGLRDPAGDHGKGPKKLVALLRAAGLSRVTERFYDDGRHEMLNETNRDIVEGDVVRWLDENVRGAR